MKELWDVLDKNGNKTGKVQERGREQQNTPTTPHSAAERGSRNT